MRPVFLDLGLAPRLESVFQFALFRTLEFDRGCRVVLRPTDHHCEVEKPTQHGEPIALSRHRPAKDDCLHMLALERRDPLRAVLVAESIQDAEARGASLGRGARVLLHEEPDQSRDAAVRITAYA